MKGVFDLASGTVRLSWTRCTDNAGVDGYNVYRNGKKVAVTGFIEYQDAIGAPANGACRYRIGALDVAGNESKSHEITVKTSLVSPATGKKR